MVRCSSALGQPPSVNRPSILPVNQHIPPAPTAPCLQSGILDKYGVELIGAKLESINKAEDRDLFAQVRAWYSHPAY